MTQTIIASVLWGLVAALASGTRRRTDQSILYAAVMIAVSLTLNVDAVYRATDLFLTGHNYADLLANLLLIVGVYFLSRAILRASSRSRARSTEKPFLIGAILSSCLTITAFQFVDAPWSSDSFMRDFGDQPAACAYSLIQFTYLGIVVAVTGSICLQFAGRMSTAARRSGFYIVGAGCWAAVLNVFSIVGMDLTHLFGPPHLLALFSSAYDVLNVASLVLLCIGLSLPPILGWANDRLERRRLQLILPDLNRIWDKVSAQRIELGRDSISRTQGARRPDVDVAVHRTLVEIRDALLLEASAKDKLTDADLAILLGAETPTGARNTTE
ncbi:hypothetical protein [Cryobacterium cryoconiti]|uniref:Histidine kinase N-terminal 7TM region domain-containing protein n=1 Tax=Cryobacterium cryoconiti TaxID=1259239 RepID=A0A4Y8JXM6_9MICO|nr:hypothetical protein [Cryobacterium cryoconiti]TFD27010.1 hypothetical protein E3T49_14075 [Cryobacterium cryoconiti]